MKKDATAAAAELRLTESGWLPEVLTNRETPTVHRYDDEDEEAEEADADHALNDAD